MAQLTLGKFFKGVPQKPEKSGSNESKKEYENKRKRGFLESWKEDFIGLEDTENGMICTVCVQFKDVAGQTAFVTGNKTYRIDSVHD